MEYLHNFEGFVNESYNETEALNEGLKSSILKGMMGNKGIGSQFLQALNSLGIAASEITDDQIFSITPKAAAKATREDPRKIFIYYSDNQKDNPFADPRAYDSLKTIDADTVMAVVKGGKYQGLNYDQYASSKGRKARGSNKALYRMADSPDETLGVSKKGKGWFSSGLTSLKRMGEVSDRVFVIDPDRVPSSIDKKAQRAEAQSGAVAFLDDKDFKKANKDRYNQILKDAAAKLPIAGMVDKAIDDLTAQIKDAIAADKKDKYGNVLIGQSPKGRDVSLKDAGNAMSNILSYFARYAEYVQKAKEETARYGKEGGSFYEAYQKEYAKQIKDYVNKISNLDYAW